MIYYICHMITHFMDRNEENIRYKYYGNLEASFQYSVEKFLELYEKRHITAFVPGIYSIPLEKQIYIDDIKREFWSEVDYTYLNGWLEGGVTILMSPLAYRVIEDIILINSRGCNDEFLWAVAHNVPVYDLDDFINNKKTIDLRSYYPTSLNKHPA